MLTVSVPPQTSCEHRAPGYFWSLGSQPADDVLAVTRHLVGFFRCQIKKHIVIFLQACSYSHRSLISTKLYCLIATWQYGW